MTKRLLIATVTVALLLPATASSQEISWAINRWDPKEGGRLDLRVAEMGQDFVGFRVEGHFRPRHLRGTWRYVIVKLDTRGSRRWDHSVTFDRVDVTSCVLDGPNVERFGKILKKWRGLRCRLRLPRLKEDFGWKVISRHKGKDLAPDRGRYTLNE